MRQYHSYKYKTNFHDMKENKLKVRYMSDLHIDVNCEYPFELDDKDTFTVIAGDIAGDYNIAKDWINKNIKNGIIIEGNHIVYNNDKLSLQKLYKRYQDDFPKDSNVTFLQNDYKIVNDVVFIGCTLWTDYRLFGYLGTREPYKCMNDFRFGIYEEVEWTGLNSKYVDTHLLPEHCINEFKISIEEIERLCDKFMGYKIVLVTHHCPSIKCLSPNYRHDNISQAYASNLEYFIKNHSNIVCWICGHSHNQCDFKIDGCRVVMNCRGYERYNESYNFKPNKSILI